MKLVDREIVRELAKSPDPEAALVFANGECVIVSVGSAVPDAGVLIARRHEIEAELFGGAVSEDRLNAIAHRLDNRARDLGA
ncbi:hypothetical protein [Actinomadura sp. 7K507]|uniref:hypothetical protein n=1 Tax=Actinomadura sp. 7K507 TaxID=2530365 RepID=UPI00104A6E9C|nr:hypothetical protein [Actinomadura sp. 7K507]TDC84032.1 hypothetical protein E1285_27635 [Actinomadura sp. 7K507]